MSFGKIKKFILGTALALTVGFSALSASACTIETDHPKAQITFEFNGSTYVLEYTLYRNMYPNTVRHFIELADNGFYNNMVIHDYTGSDWFTGGYTYNADDYASLSGSADTMREYFETYAKELEYYNLYNAGKLTPSVYSRIDYKTDADGNVILSDGKPVQILNSEYALPTLLGEFSNNIGQEIENGALTASYGCLKMYYYAKETTQHVYVTPTSDQIIEADYKTNAATSIFAVQVGTTSSYSAASYCVFAMVDDTDDLDDFTEAVSDYFSDTYGTSDYYVSTSVEVDNYDTFSTEDADRGIETTFKAPLTPIIVKSVKITKY